MVPFTQTGYGVVGRNMMSALHELGHDLKVYDIANSVDLISEKEANLYQTLKNKDFHDDSPCIRIWHQHSLDVWAGNGIKVAFPIFELDTFSDLEKHHLSLPDKIAVCSTWASEVMLDQIDREAAVVPLGIDPKMFCPASSEKNPNNDFVFLNVGKWEVRKGHDILADIFNKAFRPDDKVQLKVLASEAWSTEQEQEDWVRFYKETPMGKNIQFVMGVSSQHEVVKIMQSADAGIFPSRAEGWNLELLEMMACGKPVISTGYGAHLEFCNNENAHLVYPEDIEPAADGKFFFGQGNWAKLDEKEINEFAEKMRNVYENWAFNTEGVKTAAKFTWKNSAKTLVNILTCENFKESV